MFARPATANPDAAGGAGGKWQGAAPQWSLPPAAVKGVVVPSSTSETGAAVAEAAYTLLAARAANNGDAPPLRRVVVLSASLQQRFDGLGAVPGPACEAFEAEGGGRIAVDQTAAAALVAGGAFVALDQATVRADFELCCGQLPSVLKALDAVALERLTLLPILVGVMTPEQVRTTAQRLGPVLQDEGTVVVAVTNWSTWGMPARYTGVLPEITAAFRDAVAQPENVVLPVGLAGVLQHPANASQEARDFRGVGPFLRLDAGGFRQYLAEHFPVMSGRVVLQVLIDLLRLPRRPLKLHLAAYGQSALLPPPPQLTLNDIMVSFASFVIEIPADAEGNRSWSL